jgi:hypothetical protein
MAEKAVEWLQSIITNPLFVIGLLLVLLASYLKDEDTVKSKIAKPAKFFKNELRPLPKWLYLAMIIAGFGIVIAGVLQVGGVLPEKTTSVTPIVPAPALVGISFMTGDWNPRMIDLRTANTEGIHADPSVSLKLFDLQVSVPDSMPAGYVGQAEVYANDDEFIGNTNTAGLEAGKTVVLGEAIPFNYIDQDGYWKVQKDWSELTVLINVYPPNGEEMVQSSKTHIKFTQPNSKSWMLPPPYASFVSIVYQINNGEERSIDFRTALTDGIQVQSGDRLRLLELWYHTSMDEDTKTLFAESYVGSGEYNSETFHQTEKQVFQAGVHDLMVGKTFEWSITSEFTSLVLTLSTENSIGRSTILDRFVIPIRQ